MTEQLPNDRGAKEAFKALADTVSVGLARAAERLGHFHEDLDTGTQIELSHPQPLPGLEAAGVATSKKKYIQGVSDIGTTLNEGTALVDSTPTGELPAVLSITLTRDSENDPATPEKSLVFIGQVPKSPNTPSSYVLIRHSMAQTRGDAYTIVHTGSPVTLDAEQLRTSVVKGSPFKLAPKPNETRSLGIPGYTIDGVSSFSMKKTHMNQA